MKNISHNATKVARFIRKTTGLQILLIAGMLFSIFGSRTTEAQFSKPVVLFSGRITSAETGKASSVNVSIRSAENKEVEITSGRSNSESGKFLVVLQANKKYWVRLHSAGTLISEELIETPPATKTVQMTKDFVIGASDSKDVAQEKASR